MRECDRMCVPPWLPNFCVDGVVIRLNEPIDW